MALFFNHLRLRRSVKELESEWDLFSSMGSGIFAQMPRSTQAKSDVEVPNRQINVHQTSLNIESALVKKQSRMVLIVSYKKALDLMTRDDRFRATIYAMKTLSVHKGVYTQNESQQLFVDWASKHFRNDKQ